MSKKVGFTINDVVTTSISTSMKSLFRKEGDNSDHINLVIPANVRFKFYATRDDIILENKFSAVPLKIPLLDDM